MHIAICDDEFNETQHLKTLVMEFDSDAVISMYTSAESLLESMKNQHYDIVLLDIEMGKMDGFAAAKELVKADTPPLIIFVTNSSEYVFRGYEVAFDYLPKPIGYEMLARTLTRAAGVITPQKITLMAEGSPCILPVSEIIYVEAYGHNLSIHTKKKEINSGVSLKDLEALLPGNIFTMPHKGYLVNLDYVDTLKENDIMLTNGNRIPVSRRNKQKFEQALFRFVRRD